MSVDEHGWSMLKSAVQAHAEMNFPEIVKDQQKQARRGQRQVRRDRERKAGIVKPKQLPAQPNADNQPREGSRCPRTRCTSVTFRWSSREKVWRCEGCRMPVRFNDGVAAKNVHRDMDDPAGGGWHRPVSTITLQNCIRLLGAMLLGGPRPSHEVRAELRKQGFKRRVVNEAVTALRVRERQLQRPGPNCWTLHPKMVTTVESLVLEEIDRFLQSVPQKPR